jgi:TPR repeat protein
MKAVSIGNSFAMTSLAIICLHSDNNYILQAKEFYEKAASSGNNREEAKKLFEKAVSLGNTDAKSRLEMIKYPILLEE